MVINSGAAPATHQTAQIGTSLVVSIGVPGNGDGLLIIHGEVVVSPTAAPYSGVRTSIFQPNQPMPEATATYLSDIGGSIARGGCPARYSSFINGLAAW